uniref:Ig-like domain-containing protein n=1 Tax=Takifugu rubripes TaxID=31033 RepID=A0A674NT20_TAKRU
VLTGPDLAYIGSRVTFRCHWPDSSPPILYELMMDGIPVGMDSVYEGNQSVPFVLKVTAKSEGSYLCKAAIIFPQLQTVSPNLTFSTIPAPPSNTRVFSEPFPPVAYEGSRVVLSCNAARGSHLSYTWFFNRREVTWNSSFVKTSGNNLTMEKVTLQDAGTYSCMAQSRVQNTERVSSSTEVLLTVKVRVSKPRISFSISKEGNDYLGNVTCWSSKGTPPVNFSLTLDGREFGRSTATDSLTAWFPVTMAPELDMGMAQCRATNPVQDLVSEPVTLVVVPVGGDVIVEVDYLYGVDSTLAAVRLSCRIGRGTFPHVSWLLNASVLSETPVDPHGQPLLSHYGLADSGRTLFLTSLGPEESGYYRCRARDSYDGSGPWVESEAVLVKVTGDQINGVIKVILKQETFLQ